jgi:hypothetical protein
VADAAWWQAHCNRRHRRSSVRAREAVAADASGRGDARGQPPARPWRIPVCRQCRKCRHVTKAQTALNLLIITQRDQNPGQGKTASGGSCASSSRSRAHPRGMSSDVPGFAEREWTSLGARGLDRTGPAGEPSMAQPCAAPWWAGPDPPGRPPPAACRGPASAAVAPQALPWPASAAVGPARLQGPGQAAVTAAGCGARRPKPMSLRSRRSRALGPAPSTQPQAQARSPMASVSLELSLSRVCNVPAVFIRVGTAPFRPAAE